MSRLLLGSYVNDQIQATASTPQQVLPSIIQSLLNIFNLTLFYPCYPSFGTYPSLEQEKFDAKAPHGAHLIQTLKFSSS